MEKEIKYRDRHINRKQKVIKSRRIEVQIERELKSWRWKKPAEALQGIE